jgi:hypothetical protein
MRLEIKVNLFEEMISTGSEEDVSLILSIFENSVLQTNDNIYHILLARKPDDNCSYTVSAEIVKARGYSRVFNIFSRSWNFCDKEEEIEIISKILNKSHAISKDLSDIFNIVLIISNADNKVRIRNNLESEESETDKRKIQRGKCITSFSRERIILMAIHVFFNQLTDKHRQTFSLWETKLTQKEIKITTKLLNRWEISVGNRILNNKEKIKMLIRGDVYLDFICSMWLMKKQEIGDLLIQMCIACQAFMIH